LAEAMQAWLKDRRVLDVAVEGITIRQVMQAHDCHFLSAVSGLNDLLVRPLPPEDKAALATFLRTPLIRA
jgi:hypothetical protein